mmetsp:Transcript_142091/g.345215  ORF Transcript_142091/g.345215 Transcript_142091/m.345215 type:complete len:389 (+) Transcript_142091:119-1285(+)
MLRTTGGAVSRAAKAAGSRAVVAQGAPAAGTSWVQQQRWRSERHGPALRSGVSGLKATVFGAYGFLGRYVTARLGASSVQCVVPFRGDDMEWRHLKPMADYGSIVPMPFSPRDQDSLDRAIEGSDVVINLVGKEFDTTHYVPFLVNYSIWDTQVEVAERIAETAVKHGVTNLVHVSALAADHGSSSEWARAKAAGEEAVRSVAPGATIVRPADIFGPEDKFLNLFARMHYSLPRTLLVDGGKAFCQPVYCDDVAKAIHKIAMTNDPEVHLGQTYDLAGPDVYSYQEIVEHVFETVRAIEPHVANISPAVADAVGRAFQLFPNPLLSADRLRRMCIDNTLDEAAATKRLHDLEIEATSMETPGFNFLWRFRSGGHFLDVHEVEGKAEYL